MASQQWKFLVNLIKKVVLIVIVINAHITFKAYFIFSSCCYFSGMYISFSLHKMLKYFAFNDLTSRVISLA